MTESSHRGGSPWRKLASAWCLSLGLSGMALAQPAKPGDQANPPPEVPAWLYGVRPGDTLIGVGQRYLAVPANWKTVQRLNRIADPHRIPPGTVLRIPASLLRSTPGHATLKAVNGRVRWREPAGPWKDAAAGHALPAGAELRTEASASAMLELANGTQLRIGAGSALVLDTLSLYANGLMADTRVRVLQGQTEITDNPERRPQQNLRITTPSTQMTVRGTVFRVGVDADLTREETVEGAVTVSARGQSVLVSQAQGTVTRQGEAPLPPQALLKAPDLAGLPSQLEQLPLRFVLPAMDGAGTTPAWWGQVAPDNNFNTLLAETSSRSAALSFADLPNGRYMLRVRAVDTQGLQGLEARHAFTVLARPFAPLLQTPGHAATVRSARAPLRWTAAVGAARYRVQLAPSPAFAQPLLDHALDQTELTPTADLPVGDMHWRVASVTAQGEQGPWSASARFTYKPAPGQPDLGQAALRYEADALLLALPPPPPEQHYQVSVSQTPTMAAESLEQTSADGVVRLPRPSAGVHFLGVRLVDSQDGTAGPPMLQKITVPARYPYGWLLGLPLLLLL